MMKQNGIETELDKIRVDLYEKVKHMTPRERVAYIKAQVAPVHEAHGIKTIKEIKTDVRKMAL